jgi:hypothetical protein
MTKMIRCPVVLAAVITLACAAASSQSAGSATYIPKCAGCHGVNGIVASEFMRSRGTPSATDPNIMSLSAKQMFNSVKNGTPGMPPFKGRLTDAEIMNALSYFRELGTRASAPMSQTQSSNQSAPSESCVFVAAYSQSDSRAKAAALESFLQTYPQSVNRKAALNILMNTYSGLNDDENALGAAKRGLQVDPNDENAIFVAVEIEITECNSTDEAEVCNDAAALGQRGLSLSKPSVYTDDNWRKTIAVTYPYYRSAIALARPASPAPDQPASGAAQDGGRPAVSGKYNLENGSAQINFVTGTTCTIQVPGAPQIKGQYIVNGDTVTIGCTLSMAGLDFKIQGDKLIAGNGQVWVREGSSMESAAVPLPEIAPPPPPADTPPPEISLGQTRDQVIAAFGQPTRIAKLGGKEIFYYKDMKVTFTNGKVSNVD